MRKMIQNVCIFLTIALLVLAMVLIVITRWYISLCHQWDEEGERIEQLEADNKALITEKLQLSIKYDELYDDNVALTAAIKELRQINKELMNEEAAQDISPAPAETVKATGLLPENVHTNMFRCEPYKFAKGSQQAKLQEVCRTDPETGIRFYYEHQRSKQWFCAALAGAYGTEIGHAYTFTLANGEVIPVIMSDFKHPIDNVQSDDYGDKDVNYLGDDCLNVIEFVVDMVAIPQPVKQAGTMSALNRFGGLYRYDGDIVEVKDEGRVWRP